MSTRVEEIDQKRRARRDRWLKRKLWPPLPQSSPYFSAGAAAAIATIFVTGWDGWWKALYAAIVIPGCFRLGDELYRWLKWKKVKEGTGNPTSFVREYAQGEKRKIIAVTSVTDAKKLETDPSTRWIVYRTRWGS